MDELTRQIALNLAGLRKERRLSLEEAAAMTGVSKSMLRQVEKGASSPTISTLWKIANGLKVSFTSLMKERPGEVSVVANTAGVPLIEKDGGYQLFPLFPFEPDRKFEIYHVEIRKGARLESEGHRGGVEEYLFVSSGTLQLGVKGETRRVRKDHSIRFNASGPHSYENKGDSTVRMIMLIYYPRA
jgi:XRE family transcriptional regulator, regulator of sulfur utilization